jgi:DNA-binding transcriptional LysR family regulator
MLDPRRLLTFREVARHGSFSRAAEALHRSQPAVSHSVGALERELGTALLVRGRAGAVPTPAGELLLAHADALAARLAQAGAQMEAVVAGERGTLSVGAVPSALATIVPAAAAALRAREPGLEVAIEEGRVDALVQSVAAGRLDAAVCFRDAAAAPPEHDGVAAVELGDDPMVALLPAAHRLAGRRRIALRDLAGETWMAPARAGLLVDACRAAGFEPRIAIVTRDPLAARAVAAAGLAVSLTPRLTARVPLPGVATPALGADGPRRALYAALPAAGAHPLAARLVRELRAALRSGAPKRTAPTARAAGRSSTGT